MLPESMHDPSGPVYGDGPLAESDSDLTRQHAGEPLGERIIVTGPRHWTGTAGRCRTR